ncbi:FAD-dependent thymidylate synthase [uncultured Phascolarctobacterium sp.]|jgi:thymidylate synthase (FAD)|uniref:FAD-dependent thymidylate synthase n=1 Tax=uncultured Phascolarctobacterium sp. TaxID=512296 RepID=UPI0025E02E33|nr:FAD-dependent thymidylate synthase [uncultured Phascolarctobacterium sp.]
MPTAELISITPNHMELLKTACSQPYGKDVTEKSIEKIIESGHLSVLEHCYASFLVKCSVRVLGQLTRHRHLSFTCKSARGSKFDAIVNPYTLESASLADFIVGRTYIALNNDEGTKAEQAAYFLPQGVETSLVVTGNFRAWYEYLPKRLCRRAMPEHRELAELIHQELAKAAPEIFNRNFMGCSDCKEQSCTFGHKKGDKK